MISPAAVASRLLDAPFLLDGHAEIPRLPCWLGWLAWLACLHIGLLTVVVLVAVFCCSFKFCKLNEFLMHLLLCQPLGRPKRGQVPMGEADCNVWGVVK